MENPTQMNTNGPLKYCSICGAQLHIQAEICPKCGVRQAPVNAPQGAAASADPQQAGGVKYCTTCGAQLHMQAEICPKCGVRQAPLPNAAPQGPPPVAPAGTASRKGVSAKGLLGAFLGLLTAFLVILALYVGGKSGLQDYRMKTYNTSAENALRNVATMEEYLFQKYQVYGFTMQGKLPGPGIGKLEAVGLNGPLPAATEYSEGAMLTTAAKDGQSLGIGFEIGASIHLMALWGYNEKTGQPKYFVFAKHKQGNRLYLHEKEGTYYCANNAWIGQIDFNQIGLYPGEGVVGTPCGGRPVSTWQKL